MKLLQPDNLLKFLEHLMLANFMLGHPTLRHIVLGLVILRDLILEHEILRHLIQRQLILTHLILGQVYPFVCQLFSLEILDVCKYENYVGGSDETFFISGKTW